MSDEGAVDRPRSQSPSPEPSAESLRGLRRAAFEAVRILPKNALSRWVGRIASIALPGPLQRGEIRLFATLAGVDLDEARDGIEHFATLQQFFTRALRDGSRPLDERTDTLVSPCDGAWGESGEIAGGTILQVKGRAYRVADLLGDEEAAKRLEGGCYATFYLSPRDYHRFHTPAAGRFVSIEYHPGALWPVNALGLLGVDGLFARNERICATFVPEVAEEAPLVLVPVGATNVGSVRLTFDEVRTNVRGAARSRRDFGDRAPAFARGEEFGHFEFGSTIVLLSAPGGYRIDRRPPGTKLRLGEAIGNLDRTAA